MGGAVYFQRVSEGKGFAVKKVNFIMGLTLAAVVSSMPHPFDVWAQGSPTEDSPSPMQKNVSASEAVKLNDLAGKLSQIHHMVARLKKAAKELEQEFNRTDLRILEYDDYINQYIDDKPVAYDEQLYPYGFQNIGNTSVTGGKPLPPRKSYVDYSSGQLEDLAKMIGQEAAELLSDFSNVSKEPKISDDIAGATAALKDLEKQRDQLYGLTRDANYKKDEIIACAESFINSSNKTDLLLKTLFKSTHSRFQKN